VPTALTGSLGWTGAHPVQLGGPPLVNMYAKTIPAQATPFIAHAYQNDGVTFIKTLGPLSNRPPMKATLTNGGYDQVTIELPAKPTGITQGNIVRLTQQGGDGGIVYTGIVEALPDTIGQRTLHQVILSPLGFELDDTYTQLVYSTPTDIATVVVQAVDLTQHCSCDQVSVPPTTGILLATSVTGQVDFRNQTVKQVIDTCRSIAGPTWYWHVDELGRVWFQYQGSGSVYTITRRQYEERISDGGSIQQLRNQVVAVGGVPVGGSTNISATYNGSSQSSYGIRSLNPPLSIPNITDAPTLALIAANVGAVLDRVKTAVKLTVREGYGIKIHAAQPGGPTLRFWEPAADSLVESGAGSGAFSGPYIAQAIEWDGTTQKVAGGDVPVISQSDVDNLVKSLVSRAAANSVQVTAAALNLNQQVLTGTVVSGTGTATSPASITRPAALWSLDINALQAFDSTGQVRVQLGNLAALGGSTAGWKFRGVDASGNPVFDSDQVFGDRVMKSLGIVNAPTASFTTVANVVVPSSSLAFTLTRPANVYIPFLATGRVATNNGNVGFISCELVGVASSGNENFGVLANFAQTSSGWLFVTGLAAGSYTARLNGAINNAPQTFTMIEAALQVFQVGG
jgi:hypothetical protein